MFFGNSELQGGESGQTFQKSGHAGRKDNSAQETAWGREGRKKVSFYLIQEETVDVANIIIETGHLHILASTVRSASKLIDSVCACYMQSGMYHESF